MFYGNQNRSKRTEASINFILSASSILAAVICLVALAQANGTQSDHEMQQSYYCDMVKLYKDSNGENGWPDYKNTYAEVCNG